MEKYMKENSKIIKEMAMENDLSKAILLFMRENGKTISTKEEEFFITLNLKQKVTLIHKFSKILTN